MHLLDHKLRFVAPLAQFFWFDEEGIDVHIFGNIGHTPFHSFDHHKITERVAVERVEKEKAAWFQNAARLGNEALWLFHMLEHIHCADDIERCVRVGEGVGIGLLVTDSSCAIVRSGNLQTRCRKINPKDLVSRLGKSVREHPRPTPHIENLFAGSDLSEDPWNANCVFRTQKGDGVVARRVPLFSQLIVEVVIYCLRTGLSFHTKFQNTI